jgi:hypothetical protein
MNPPTVVFVYCKESGTWEAFVNHVESPIEAAQAFNSVILTCKTIKANALPFTQVGHMQGDMYRVVPAEIVPDPEMN